MKFVAIVAPLLLGAGMFVLGQEKAADAKPQPEHALLKQFEGEWDVRAKWMAPGKPVEESAGSDRSRMALGGYWLISDFKGEYDRKPFEGHSMTGFDPKKGVYVSVCGGSQTPHLTAFEGRADASGKKFTYHGQCVDPESGQPVSYRVVQEITDEDHRRDHVYTVDKDGKEKLTGELTYTRKAKTEAK